MTKSEFKQHVESKIKELESMPYDGQEFGDFVFDESEFLDYCGYVVREVYIKAAAFGFVQKPPVKLMSRSEALYYLRQGLAFLDGQEIEGKELEFLTVEQAAERLQVSKDSIYDLINKGRLEHTKVGRIIRIKASALDHIAQDDGW